MNSNTILRSWNGRTIRQREDGYICLTDMAQACDREFRDWNRLDGSKRYIEALSSDVGICTSQLIEIRKGNSNDFEQGTWGHKLVALEFSRWLSPEFSIQCNKWVEELLLKGYVSIENQPRISSEDDKEIKLLEMGIKLAERIKDDRALIVYSTQLSNLLARIQSKLTPKNQELLPAPIWLTFTEVLTNNGYSLNKKEVQNSLGQIGKLIKASYILETEEEPRIITKLVGTNHKATEIKLYPESFFSRICEIACDYWERKNIIL